MAVFAILLIFRKKSYSRRLLLYHFDRSIAFTKAGSTLSNYS